jgi:hypothetical protein
MAEPILTLNAIADRRTVRINAKSPDGTPVLYTLELLSPAELSILDYHQLGKKQERIAQLMNGDLDDAGVRELEQHLDWSVRKVLLAPDEIVAQLGVDNRFAIITAFTGLLRVNAPAAGEKSPAPSEVPSTGESTSPGSSASSEALP